MVQDRPRYHFVPPANWMNDPNGLIEWGGIYHLFYQYNPHGPLHGTIHWGHACSPDLVRWSDLPIALEPTADSPDAGGCWSGCAVNDQGVPTLMYTGITTNGSGYRESQCIATGSGDMIRWRKHPQNPVIAAPPPGMEVIGFRDPFVWREGGDWRCIIGTGISGIGGAILLYRSHNLLSWEYVGVLCAGDSTVTDPVWTGSMWECPQFFALGDSHILIFSVWDSGKTKHTVYAVGAYHGDRFYPEAMHRLDLGSSFYAPATMRDDRGRRLMWGWLREGRRKAAVLEAGWSGAQSMPRVVSLGDDHTLRFSPAEEIATLRGAHTRLENLVVPDSVSPVAVPYLSGDALELQVVIDLRASTAEIFGVRIRRSSGDEEYTSVLFNRLSRQLLLDREHSSLSGSSYRGVISGAAAAMDTEQLTLRIFLDRSVVEVYADDTVCLTERVYPTRADSTGVALVAQGGTARVTSLDAWEMGADGVVPGDDSNN